MPEEDLEAHRFDANNLQTSHLNMSISNNMMGIDVDTDDFNEVGTDFDTESLDSGSEMNRLALQPQSGLTASDLIDDIRSRSMHSVAELTTLISQSPSDYSYFDLGKLKLHDLPKHLKLIANRLVNEKKDSEFDAGMGSGSVTPQIKTATVRNRKEIPKLDFGIVIDRSKFFKITKKAIFLGDKTLEKRSEKPFRIENERQIDFNGKELFQPYFKAITVSS